MSMSATNVSVTDDVIREIGEQVSQILRRRLPKWRGTPFKRLLKWGGTPLDPKNGIMIYQAYCGISAPMDEFQFQDIREKAPNEAGVYVIKHKEKIVYVGRAGGNWLGPSTKGLRKRLLEHEGGGSNIKELEDCNPEELSVEIYPTGSAEAAKQLEAGKIRKFEPEWNKRNEKENRVRIFKDASTRIVGNVAGGIVSDVAMLALGGAAWEIRDAYRNPGTMSLMGRCERLIRTICERLREILKDRSLREIGSETILGMISALTSPLEMAYAAIEKAVDVLRRLWMEFVSGKIRTLSDLIAACLKAIFVITSAGIALLLEAKLTPLMAVVPGGDVLSAVIAAVVSGVMIVIGNRFIGDVVRALFSISSAGTRARIRRQEIQRMCEEAIPRLIEDRERLQALVDSHFTDREALLDATFEDMQFARKRQDIDGYLKGLNKLNEAYGKALPWASLDEFNAFMRDDSQALKF